MRTKREILDDLKDAISMSNVAGSNIMRLRELEVQIDIRDLLEDIAHVYRLGGPVRLSGPSPVERESN